jgi:23S rRNA pseudouridine2605 synthase
MAKRNSSGSSSKRGSSRSTGKSFSSRNSDKSNNRSERAPRKSSFSRDEKPESGDRKSSRPSAKFDREKPRKSSDEGKSFGKSFDRKDQERPRRPTSFSKDEKSSGMSDRRAPKSFDKRDDSRRSSFGKSDKFSAGKDARDNPRRSSSRKDDIGSENKDRSFSNSKRNSPSAPKKFTKPFDKSSRSDERGEEKEKRYSSSPRRYGSGKTFNKKFIDKRELDEKRNTDPDKIRLNRYIANSGICSRREADEYITMGLVSVNGKVITELGYKVNRSDEVRYESKVLKAEKPVYILMNKPKGYLTTTKDPEERKTVMHILGSEVKERVYPVGRLDRNTTGLLLLTNDGDLADKLMHPSYNIKKIYKVELDRPMTKADFKKVQEGVRLEEGKTIVDDLAVASEDGKTIGIEIHIGWNRVVRRIFESLQYEVVKLDRTSYAGLDKKDLPRGHWRYLKKEEVVHLKHFK